MLSWISLTALLTVSAPLEDPAGGAKAATVAPVLGEGVLVVGYVDLTKVDAAALVRLAGKTADEEAIRGAIGAIGGWTGALKTAGGKDLFVLFDLADVPGTPVVVVPLTAGSDGKGIADVLAVELPASEMIRGAVVAGTPRALARIRTAQPSARPELAEALTAGGGAAVRIVVMPSRSQRRAIEESMTNLPHQLGGGPVSIITQGLRWLLLAPELEPKPMLRAVVQAKDAEVAKAQQKIIKDALDWLAVAIRNDPSRAALATKFSQVKPEAKADRVTLEAELEKSAELVALPFRLAREAARQSQCSNNLKQICLAMLNYELSGKSFPPAYNVNTDGKPLLSWRVHLLPFLGSKALYDEFHREEPWDSPHNKALMTRMPPVYACPSANKALAREGKTTTVTIRGPATMFPGAEGTTIQGVTDGLANTILVVDASDAAAVAWTKPDDWEMAHELKSASLFGHHPAGTYFGLADGGVRFLKAAMTPRVLKAMTTRNGGEIIGADDY